MSDKHIQNPPVGHTVCTTQKNSQQASIKCSECEEMFDSTITLESHTRNNHSDYSCIQCGEAFTTKKDINNHKLKEHNNTFEGLSQYLWLSNATMKQPRTRVSHGSSAHANFSERRPCLQVLQTGEMHQTTVS